LIALLIATQAAEGGFCTFGLRNRGVGGVSIDSHGVVRKPTVEEIGLLAKSVRELTDKTPDAMTAPVGLRKISLRRLEEAIRAARKEGRTVLPDEITFLAGLQRIEYVFVFPEEHDIVIAGPGEGWMVNERGEVVGVTTGRPVMQLDDLLVALRSADAARTETISVSIDPTNDGRKAYAEYLSTVRRFSKAAVAEAARRMGPQQVSITGVPADSHFARVMVAADVHMKRYQMGFDPSPVKELPSYLQMLKSSGGRLVSATPRWWLECNYEPLGRSEDGLAWHVRGPGVKAVAADDAFRDGEFKGTGRANPHAQKWADMMTEHYDEFAARQPVFGELRNLMDMSVLAALLQKEDLLGVAGLELPVLMGKEGGLEISSWHAPKTIDTQCSFIQSGREYIITASGGVDINSWEVASRSKVEAKTAEVRTQAVPADKAAWWWN
jgi:hypothetical protein